MMRVALESFTFNFLFLCAVITLDIINIESGRADSMTTLSENELCSYKK